MKIFILFFIICAVSILPMEVMADNNTAQYPKPKTNQHVKTPQMATPGSGKGMPLRGNSHDGKLSCIGSTSLFARLVYDVLSIGYYEVVRGSFSMTDTGTCNNIDPTITYKVLHYKFPFSWDWSTYVDEPGDSNYFIIPPLVMKTANQSDQLCVQLWMPLLGYQNIGCKYQADPSVTNANIPCFVAASCNGDQYNGQNLFRITSSVIQCLRETINTMFVESDNCKNNQGVGALNSFSQFRDSMRNIVRMLLVLYVMFFGFKTALGGEMPPAAEVVTFGLKMIFVLYFSVGLPSPTGENGYQDGVVSLVLPFFLNASSDLADMMYSAGGIPGLCYYDPATYSDGFSYLALWDSIDCRIAYYLGLDYNKGTSVKGAWELIVASILGFQIVFVIVLIIFLVFFVSIIVHFTHVFVLSIIAISLLVYMAPLFVPFALFNQTKGFFDGWLKQLTSYTLQPMIMASFIALMLTVFDSQAYGTCVIKAGTVPESSWLGSIAGDKVNLGNYKSFGVDPASLNDPKCTQSWGYVLTIDTAPLMKGRELFFFSVPVMIQDAVDQMLKQLLTLVLFSFLFHALANQVGLIAGDLTGGAPLSKMAGSATALFDKAASMAKGAIKSQMGDKSKKDLDKAEGGKGGSVSDSGGASRPGAGGGGAGAGAGAGSGDAGGRGGSVT